MLKRSQIILFIGILSLLINLEANAQNLSSTDYAPKYDNNLINSLYSSSTTKLEDIMQRLDSVKADTEKNYAEVKNHLEDTSRRMKLLVNEQSQVKEQLKTLDTELKTINTIKKRVQKDIDKNKEVKKD